MNGPDGWGNTLAGVVLIIIKLGEAVIITRSRGEFRTCAQDGVRKTWVLEVDW